MNQKLILVLAMLLVATVAFAQQNPSGQGPTDLNGGLTSTPSDGFTGAEPNNQGGPGLGRHDLQDATSHNPLGCETCHLPHTSPSYGRSFLWAWRNLPSNLPTYVTPTNPSGALALPTGINGNSRSMLCFSCHDATSATNNGISSSNVIAGAGGPYPLVTTAGGTSNGLQTEHPVDAMFPTTNDYVQPTLISGMYGAIATVGVDTLPLWGAGTSGGSTPGVECGTCHDVHNDYLSNGPAGSGGVPFLRVGNLNGTYLCRECHNAQ